MAGLDKPEGGNVRASDRDRNEVAAQLRVHCVDGRITFEELERRVEEAMSAATIDQLAGVLNDLPAINVPAEKPDHPQRVRVGPPGIRPFTYRIVVPAPIERTRAVAPVPRRNHGDSRVPEPLQKLRTDREEAELGLALYLVAGHSQGC